MEAAKKIYDFLDNAKTYFLATVEGDQPRVRPYGSTLFYEGKIFIMAWDQTNATRQLVQNPKAEICAFKGQTLRIECKLVEDKRQELKDAIVEKIPGMKGMLGENNEKAIMYQLTEATATFYKLMEPVETVTF